MATREELLKALREAGYDGPTSYTKGKLEEILAAQTPPKGRTSDQPPSVQAMPGHIEGDPSKTVLKEWCGLVGRHHVFVDGQKTRVPGTQVRVQGEPGKKFEFVSHVTTASGLEHVEVVGPIPAYGTTRCFDPSRILDVKRRKPVMA